MSCRMQFCDTADYKSALLSGRAAAFVRLRQAKGGRRSNAWRWLAFAISFFLSHSALAHDPFQGTAIARVSNDALELTVTLARSTVESNLLSPGASASLEA